MPRQASQFSTNVLANISQVVLGSALLFGAYRYIKQTIGIDSLGVWSVVLSTVSMSRLADLGLSAGATRFVARDLARGDAANAIKVIDTVSIALITLSAILLPALSPAFEWGLVRLFDGVQQREALHLLPFALASLWVTVPGSIFLASLDGCQRMEIRAGLVILGQLFFLGLTVLLLPTYGIVGIGWAQIGQGLFCAIGGRIALRKVLCGLSFVPHAWSNEALRNMIGYGLHLQAAAVFMILMDPTAKAMMAFFGGASTAGYFESANQFVLRARTVIVAANQAIVPRIAEVLESNPGAALSIYCNNMRVLIFITLPTCAILLLWAAPVSWLMLNEHSDQFLAFSYILTIAWCVNVFAGPSYFFNLGAGFVSRNTWSSFIMGTTNAAFGLLLGWWCGPAGVVSGYAISVVTGSSVLIYMGYATGMNCDGDKRWKDNAPLAACAGLAIIASLMYACSNSLTESDWLVVECTISVIMLGVLWVHPLRSALWNKLGHNQGRINR